MTTVERKEKIINQLAEVDDDVVLNAIEQYLERLRESRYPNGIWSEKDLLGDISISMEQFQAGRFKPQNVVKDLIKTWQK
jgi:hypothetical protein